MEQDIAITTAARQFFVMGPEFERPVEITDFTAEVVNLGLRDSMQLPFGTVNSRPSGLVRVQAETDGEILDGYGEGATLPEPLFTDDSGHNIAKNAEKLLAPLKGHSVTLMDAVDHIGRFAFKDSGLYPTARLACEMSLIDLHARANGQSVKQMIGIADEITSVPYGFSIGASNKAEAIRLAERAINQKASKIKLKISPESHQAMVETIGHLQHNYPDVGYMIDANGTYDPNDEQHLKHIEEVDALGLLMFEEPVSRVGNTLGLHAMKLLRSKLPTLETPICLDDSLKRFEDCRVAIETGLAQVINIKPGRVGSFIQSLRLIDWVAEQGGQVMVGGMIEATPGRCMTTLLGAYCLSRGFTIPGDLSLAQERLTDDLVDVDKQLRLDENGMIRLPTSYGWGFHD